ncbi:MAG TPA: hypothetical protein VIG90_09630 [Pedomonas sp.]|uniref:hypothetical protein n=1 Tax=Pedomonas sp. TaxID=2976421 RepID=UPI002F3F2ABC
MPSLIYNSALEDLAKGAINFATDSFKLILVDASYVPNKDTQSKRSQVTGEVVGAGYAAGGKTVTATVARDDANDRVDVTFSSVTWADSTITARGAVIYKSRGGAATADELVAYCDFGANVSSTGASFTANFTSPFRLQN